MTKRRRAPAQEIVIVSTAYAALLAPLLLVTGRTPERDGRGHDGRFYAAMAADERYDEPFVPVAPFCYRVLTPLLVARLPGGVVSRFVAFNSAAWLAALVLWHLLARRTGLGPRTAALGGFLLATSAWGPMTAFYNPCYVDPLMYVFVIGGLLLMLRRSRWLWLLLAVAMLQREQCAIVWVCALVHEVQTRGWSARTGARFGLMFAGCAGVVATMRLAVTPLFATTPAPWTVVFGVAQWLLGDPSYALKSLLAVLYALGPPLIGVILLPDARRFVRRQRWPAYYLFLCFLSLFGGSDKARLAFLAQPVLVLVFVHGLRRLAAPAQGRFAVRLGLVAVVLLHLFIQFPPSLMIADGRLLGPLVDEMDRATHGANSALDPGYWPVPLGSVALHVAIGVGLAVVLMTALRLRLTAAPLGRAVLFRLPLVCGRRRTVAAPP